MIERFEEGIAVSQEAQRNHDAHLFGYLAEVSGLGLLGREKEAQEALHRLRKVQPDISISFIENSIPIVKSEGRDRFLRGLKLAGMSQNSDQKGSFDNKPIPT
jgi:hypothetical protein